MKDDGVFHRLVAEGNLEGGKVIAAKFQCWIQGFDVEVKEWSEGKNIWEIWRMRDEKEEGREDRRTERKS